MFKLWLESDELKHPNLDYIGQVAVFYIPTEKLNKKHEGQTTKELLHDYLIHHFNAYTLVEGSDTQGFWRKDDNGELHEDKNAKYEVSFEGKDKIKPFIDFLSKICSNLDEKSIYLRMGSKSWLVKPKP